MLPVVQSGCAMHGRIRAEKVSGAIRERIETGEYAPGSYLPSERALSAELGVARNTLRAALEMIEEGGFIRRSGRHGAVVCERAGSSVGGLVLVVMKASPSGGFGPIAPEQMANLGGLLCAGSRADLRMQLLAMPDGDADMLLEVIGEKRAAGALFLADKQVKAMSALHKAGIPYVVVNQEYDIPGPATRVDFWGIGRRAAEHLLQLGHRRLAVLGGPSERHMYEKLLAGFRGMAAESEVFMDARCVVRVPSSSEAARAATLDMLKRPDRPTAIFCTRDVRAYGAYLAARELGLKVPEDVSLLGYDDLTWPGREESFLSTFPEPTERLAGEAVRMLISWIQTGEEPEDVILRPKLLVRRSTAPCKESGTK